MRATAQGLTYNIGRIASADAPRLVGSIAEAARVFGALSVTAAAFLAATVFWVFIPETKGRQFG